MAVKRTERVGPLIFEEVSRVLRNRLSDPRLDGLTFTKVKMTADLKIARVYFSVIGSPEQVDLAKEALAGAKGVFKRAISRNLSLRYMPELQFYYDQNLEYADKIERVLREIKQQEQSASENGDHESSD